MNKLLAIYAAVIFIAGVIVFTIGVLNKDNEEEHETYKWMRVFAMIAIVLAIACAIACKATA
jgi:protein-S-isoprenylcysteine O-methyltransferase Ste14